MAQMIRELIETFVVETVTPTGKNLIPTIKFSVLITVLVLLCKLLGVPSYFSISGCVLGLVVLFIVLILERKEYAKVEKLYNEVERRSKDEISKLRRTGELYLEKSAKGRQQNSGSGIEDERADDLSDEFEGDAHR